MNKGNNNQKAYQYRIKGIQTGSLEDQLCQWIKDGDYLPINQLLLWTLRSHWLPIYLAMSGQGQTPEGQMSAIASLHQLEIQAQTIRQMYGLSAIASVSQLANSSGMAVPDIPAVETVEDWTEDNQEADLDDDDTVGQYDIQGLNFDS